MLNNFMAFIDYSRGFYITLAAIVLSMFYYVINNRGLPPGPIGLPYIGYWPFLSNDSCHFEMHELSKKYGDILSFTVTGRTFIHLGSYKVTKEAHITKSDCFSDRMKGYNILASYLEGGLMYNDLDKWKVMRKFFSQQFRELSMNVIRESNSGAIYDTVKETVTELKKLKNEPVDISDLFISKSNKIMRLAMLGEDGMTDKELKEFGELYLDVIMSITAKNGLLVGEIARYFIIPFCKGISKGRRAHHKMKKMLYKVIDRRKATYNENHIRDIIDAYYKEKDSRLSKNDPTYKYFTDKFLVITLDQILGDGVFFLGLFVADFIKAVLDHPEEQEKLYKELVDVCGLHRDPIIEDKSKLTYTNAFILEVMRTTKLLTMFHSLECTKETTISGYRIPKGTITVYNFYSAHMNIKDYEQPEKFYPSRFIAERDKRPELLSVFGIGKRACMGEGFAMNQVFLFLTTLVKNFRLSKPFDKDSKPFDKVYLLAESRSHS